MEQDFDCATVTVVRSGFTVGVITGAVMTGVTAAVMTGVTAAGSESEFAAAFSAW